MSFLHNYINDNFCGKIVASGNYEWHPGSIIRCQRGPIKLVKQLIKRHAKLMFNIDEYNTSKLCNKCDNILSNYKDGVITDPNPIKRLPWCKLKTCKFCNQDQESIRIIERDINASLNIIDKCIYYINNLSDGLILGS